MEPKIPARAELEGFIPFLTQQAQLQLSRLPWLRMEAEELIQRTMLEAWESLDSYRGDSEAQLAKWLQTILKRQLSRELRHVGQKCRDRKRVISLQLALEESSARLRRWVAADDSSVGQHAIRKERAVRLTAALEQLPADQRLAVSLHHLENWSLAEVAQKMHRSQPAVAGLLQRGLKKLHDLLDGQEGS